MKSGFLNMVMPLAMGIVTIAGLNVAQAAQYYGKTVGKLQGFYDDADCFYFQLNGVSEADPVKPGDAWFAVSRTQYGAKDAYAMLLAAKISGKTVNVSTRGTLTCNYAGIAEITME